MSLSEHIQTIKREDPAAKSSLEILLCYPGLHAVITHRLAHWLYGHGWYVLARVVSHISRLLYLFSYGTLQQEAVQVSTFGRKLEGEKDALPGFREALVKIDDPGVVALSGKTHHPIVQATGEAGDSVAGMVFLVTPQELLNADTYEVSAYRRIFSRRN